MWGFFQEAPRGIPKNINSMVETSWSLQLERDGRPRRFIPRSHQNPIQSLPQIRKSKQRRQSKGKRPCREQHDAIFQQRSQRRIRGPSRSAAWKRSNARSQMESKKPNLRLRDPTLRGHVLRWHITKTTTANPPARPVPQSSSCSSW